MNGEATVFYNLERAWSMFGKGHADAQSGNVPQMHAFVVIWGNVSTEALLHDLSICIILETVFQSETKLYCNAIWQSGLTERFWCQLTAPTNFGMHNDKIWDNYQAEWGGNRNAAGGIPLSEMNNQFHLQIIWFKNKLSIHVVWRYRSRLQDFQDMIRRISRICRHASFPKFSIFEILRFSE